MLRMYDPQSGSIKVNQTDLKEVNLEQFRCRIGYVPQDVFLFSDTIQNNINFGSVDNFDHAQLEHGQDDVPGWWSGSEAGNFSC